MAASVRALSANPAVEFAEPNWIYQHQATSNDPYYTNGSLWGMYGDATVAGQPVRQPGGEAWAAGHTGCSTVYRRRHRRGHLLHTTDLAANVWTNPSIRPTASTTTATATSTTSTAGTSTATATTSIRAAPPTTTARTWPAPSAAWAATAGRRRRVLDVKLITASSSAAAAADGQRDQGGRLLHRPEDPSRPEHRRDEQLVGRRRLLAGAAGRDRPRQHGEHPVHRRGRQQRLRQRHHRQLSVELPERQHHRGRFDHQHRRPVELLAVGRHHGRPRCAGLGHLLDGAGELEGQRRLGLRQLQRHLDGHPARDRRRGAVRPHPGATAADIKAAILGSAVPTTSLRIRSSPAAA